MRLNRQTLQRGPNGAVRRKTPRSRRAVTSRRRQREELLSWHSIEPIDSLVELDTMVKLYYYSIDRRTTSCGPCESQCANSSACARNGSRRRLKDQQKWQHERGIKTEQPSASILASAKCRSMISKSGN